MPRLQPTGASLVEALVAARSAAVGQEGSSRLILKAAVDGCQGLSTWWIVAENGPRPLAGAALTLMLVCSEFCPESPLLWASRSLEPPTPPPRIAG